MNQQSRCLRKKTEDVHDKSRSSAIMPRNSAIATTVAPTETHMRLVQSLRLPNSTVAAICCGGAWLGLCLPTTQLFFGLIPHMVKA